MRPAAAGGNNFVLTDDDHSVLSATVDPGLVGGTPPVAPRGFDEVERLRQVNPMCDSVVEEIEGRRIRVGDTWLADFASCNYLGFDLEPEIAAAISDYLARWGTHPSWARMVASPRLFTDIETELTALLSAEDTLVLPTISLIHLSVLPALVQAGTLLVDTRAHHTIHEGSRMARAQGATVRRIRADEPDRVDRALRLGRAFPKVVCVDGINSMTGNPSPLRELAAVTRRHGALLYVDDAHGFGVLGRREPTESSPFGAGDAGVLAHLGLDLEGIILVSGFSKSYSSLAAFVACSTATKNYLKVAAPPYIFSGPPPVASLATVLAGFRVNASRGDDIRADLYHKTAAVLAGLEALGLRTLNRSGFPIIEVPLRDADDVDAIGRHLFARGIHVTLAPYPVVAREEAGFRIQVTAANTDGEIAHLLEVMAEIADRCALYASPA
jgi:8-amino-7-oxononanoate synthase